MEFQPPAEGISYIYRHDDFCQLEVRCDCQDPDHSIIVEFDGHDYADITVYTKGSIPFWRTGYNRFKAALKILFTGKYEVENVTCVKTQVLYNLAKSIINEVEKKK